MKSFDIPEIYKSNLIAKIKEKRRLKDKLKKDFSPTILNFDTIKVLIARHFGFCYGVENAIEIAYKTLKENPNKQVYLLSEMIHNQEVNKDLLSRGVKFLMDTKGNKNKEFENLHSQDVVIVPAFGTTIEIQNELTKKGIDIYKYDTTCPFVEKVWNRASQIGERGYTIIIHGKPIHEETRATFSHSKEKSPTLIINDMEEAIELACFIRKEKSKELFLKTFEGRFSIGFDPDQDLERIGVVNQTTMLATETQAIADYLKQEIIGFKNLVPTDIPNYFANTRDTLCYATNDNQDATYELLSQKADLAFVIGGYNSSNTTHLVELLEKKMPTYFIQSQEKIISDKLISHFDIHKGNEIITEDYFPKEKIPTIVLTCGASCPDSVVEDVLLKILSFFKEEENLENQIHNL